MDDSRIVHAGGKGVGLTDDDPIVRLSKAMLPAQDEDHAGSTAAARADSPAEDLPLRPPVCALRSVIPL